MNLHFAKSEIQSWVDHADVIDKLTPGMRAMEDWLELRAEVEQLRTRVREANTCNGTFTATDCSDSFEAAEAAGKEAGS